MIDEKTKYAKLLNEASATFGNERRAKEEVDKLNKEAKKEHELAQTALSKGNEEDAKILLLKEQEIKKQLETLLISYNATKNSADLIRKTLDECKANIKNMEQKAQEIKAKAVATKSINMATDIASSKKNIATDDAFKRLQEKADKEYNTALGKAEYINSPSVEQSIEEKYINDTADDGDTLLAELKAEIDGTKTETIQDEL